MAHRVEETEVLGEQVVDGLEDELKKVGLHGRRLLRRKGVFFRTLRHAEVLNGTGETAGHLGNVPAEAGIPSDIDVDGVGGLVALLFGEDGFSSRSEARSLFESCDVRKSERWKR